MNTKLSGRINMVSAFGRGIVLLLSCLSLMSFAWAQANAPTDPKAVFEAAKLVEKAGPQDIVIAGQGTLKLPPGFVFIPQPNATALMQAMGNPGEDPRLHGLIFPKAEGNWVITVNFEPAGYIKEDDAKTWNADELLASVKSGTEASNDARKKMGSPELEVVGWAEKPAYDAQNHRLVWAMSAKHRGAPANEPQSVNYNTYALGREGYFVLNLITDLSELESQKPMANAILAALTFENGRRYSDFNAATDRVAEYGLAALVAGAAAKKLGLIAVILAFFAKFAKVFILGFAVFGGAFFKFFKRKKVEIPVVAVQAPVETSAPTPTPPPNA
jgi:uncharacterized membrane-anchored protein